LILNVAYHLCFKLLWQVLVEDWTRHLVSLHLYLAILYTKKSWLWFLSFHPWIHTGGAWRGVRGIKVYPPSKFFAKLINKNAIKHQKSVPSPPKKCSQPLYTLHPKIWQKPHGPFPWIFKPCASMVTGSALPSTLLNKDCF